MREGGMCNVAEQRCFHPLWESVGRHSSPGHIFLGTPLALCLLVDRGKLMPIDGRGTVADKRLTGGCQPPLQRAQQTQKYTDALFEMKRGKTSIPSHFNHKDSRWVTTVSSSGSPPLPMEDNNKRPPRLTQKSLKVTEWILIRSGVVNGSQHGLQWD